MSSVQPPGEWADRRVTTLECLGFISRQLRAGTAIEVLTGSADVIAFARFVEGIHFHAFCCSFDDSSYLRFIEWLRQRDECPPGGWAPAFLEAEGGDHRKAIQRFLDRCEEFLRPPVQERRPRDEKAERVALLLAGAPDPRAIDDLPREHAVVVRAWWARGALGNGGFRFLLADDDVLDAVEGAFRELELPAVADACAAVKKELARISPHGLGPPASEQRHHLWASIDWKAFEPQEREVLAVTWEALLDAIKRYMDRNPGAFSRVAPLE